MPFYGPLHEPDMVSPLMGEGMEDPELLDGENLATTPSASIEPGLTPVEEEERPLDDHDRAIAARIEDQIRAWEQARASRREAEASDAERRAEITRLVKAEGDKPHAPQESLVTQVEDLYNGLFGLERYLRNPQVSDILLNAYDKLFVEERGEKTQRLSPLHSPEDYDRLIERLAKRTEEHRMPTYEEPSVDGRLWWEVAGVMTPVRLQMNLRTVTSTGDSTICLRKPVATGYDHLETWTLVHEGESISALTPVAAEFLRQIVSHRANILLVGSTGSGKTSLLKALLECVNDYERVIVIEDASEIDLRNVVPDYVGLVAHGGKTIADHLRAAMRMRPDRIIVGECREPSEVAGFLRAINTGHAGSITTTHASSARDGLQGLLTLAAQDVENKASVEHVGQLIRTGIDAVVYLGAQYIPGPDGRPHRVRRVMEIGTMADFDPKNTVFTLTYPFGRFVGPGQKVTDIGEPLRNEGFGYLSPTFLAHMRTQGLSEDQMRKLLATGLDQTSASTEA